MKKNSFQVLSTVAWFLLIPLSGCAAPTQPVSSNTPSQIVLVKSITPPLPTWTSAPTDTPMPSATPTIKPTMTRPPSATPTLSPEQAKSLVKDLLHTNGGCELPCWWGFTPGETAWANVKKLFKSLKATIEINTDRSQGVVFDFSQENLILLQLNFVVDSTGLIQQIGIKTWLNAPNKQVIYNDSNYQGLMGQYSVDQVLLRLGTPSDIYVYYEPDPQIGVMYELLLFYPERGTFLRYSGQSQQVGGQALLCPIGKSQVDLWMWSSQKNVTALSAYLLEPNIKKGHESRLDPEKGIYLPLAEATGIDVNAFYEMFSQPGSEDPCLQTPVQMWKDKFKP